MTKTINLNLKNILSNQNPEHIQIIKISNPLYKKNVTSVIDMNRIMTFLKSITTKKKISTQIKGWTYSITIINTNGRSFNIELMGDKIGYNNSFYFIDRNIVDAFSNLYNSLK